MSILPVRVSIPLWNLQRIPPNRNTLSEFADRIADEFAEDFIQVETGLRRFEVYVMYITNLGTPSFDYHIYSPLYKELRHK